MMSDAPKDWIDLMMTEEPKRSNGYCIECNKRTNYHQKGEYICKSCQLPDEPKRVKYPRLPVQLMCYPATFTRRSRRRTARAFRGILKQYEHDNKIIFVCIGDDQDE